METSPQAPQFKFCPMCGTKLEGRRVEEGRERSTCPECGYVYYPHPHTAVAAVIWNGEKREVLLVRRAQSPKKGLWSLPAGFIEYGEHPEEALARELAEETGLKMIAARLLGVKKTLEDPRAPGTLVFFYEVDVAGKPINDNRENSQTTWWPIKALPEVGWRTHRETLADLS